MSELIYQKAENYDQLFKENPDLIEFYRRQATQSGSRILELACGTGRIALALARDGHSVTGIDISREMLEIAERKSQSADISTEWIYADMRDFAVEKTFDMIILSGNSLCHLFTIEDFEKCMTSVKKHLAISGKFIIDVFMPSLKILNRNSEERFPFSEYQDTISGEKVIVTSSAHYDAATQINHIKTFYQYTKSLKEETGSLTMRMYFPEELRTLVKYNGFRIESRFGNYDLSEFDENSGRQILILKATH